MLDVVNDGLNVFQTDRAFFQRSQQAVSQFVFIKGLPTAIALDHPRQHQFGTFKGREAFTALLALAAAPDLIAIGDQAGVDYLGFAVTTKWAMQDGYPHERGNSTVFGKADQNDALWVIGSSLKLFSGYRFCRHAVGFGKPIALLNPGWTRADPIADLKIIQPAEIILPKLLSRLTNSAQ